MQHQHFLERDRAVGSSVRRAGEIFIVAHLAFIHGHGRELVHEAPQRFLEGLLPHVLPHPFDGARHDARVLQLVLAHDDVQDLVDQSHRVDVAGGHRRASHGADSFCELARCGEVRDDHASVRREERLVKLVFLPRRARDMEFKGEDNGHGMLLICVNNTAISSMRTVRKIMEAFRRYRRLGERAACCPFPHGTKIPLPWGSPLRGCFARG